MLSRAFQCNLIDFTSYVVSRFLHNNLFVQVDGLSLSAIAHCVRHNIIPFEISDPDPSKVYGVFLFNQEDNIISIFRLGASDFQVVGLIGVRTAHFFQCDPTQFKLLLEDLGTEALKSFAPP